MQLATVIGRDPKRHGAKGSIEMKFPGKLAGGIGAAALVASAALAQDGAAPVTAPPVRSDLQGGPQPATLPPQGQTVAEAFNRLYYFERAAETYIRALQTGQPLRVLPDAVAEKTAREWEAYPGFAAAHLREIKAMLDESGDSYAS